MNWAMPLPINENAGINIQNHHAAPIDRESAIEMIRNAMPVKTFFNAMSSVNSLWRRRGPNPSSAMSRGAGWANWPVNA